MKKTAMAVGPIEHRCNIERVAGLFSPHALCDRVRFSHARLKMVIFGCRLRLSCALEGPWVRLGGTMGTITKKTNKDGSISYKAEVRQFAGKVLLARKSLTFPSQREAKAWITRTEAEFAQGSKIPVAITVGDLVTRYIEKMEKIKPLGRSRKLFLEGLAQRDIWKRNAPGLTTQELLDYFVDRRKEAGPSTLIIDLSTLAGVFRDAKSVLGVDVDDKVFAELRPTLLRMGLVERSGVRNRRPTDIEIRKLLEGFRKREKQRGNLIPMVDLVEFLLASAFRLGEVCDILWSDYDDAQGTVLVRDRKHPRQKHDDLVTLPRDALEIIRRQPKTHTRIFPYESRSVSTAFTRTAKSVGVENLRLHDLRREGISRLLEKGLLPHEVATISGHRDLKVLNLHYTRISSDSMRKRLDEVDQ